MREVFRRTMYLDLHLDSADGMLYQFVRGNSMALPWEVGMGGTPLTEKEQHTIIFAVSRDMYGNQFHTRPTSPSSEGLLGFCRINGQPGDELWMLKGGKVLYLLRPKPMTIPSADLTTSEPMNLPVDVGVPTYQFVCEAFVLGLMDGEIIDMMGDTPKRERPPPLADMDREFRTIGLI